MNKDESLALYAQGHEAWNAWAKEMLARRSQMEGAGQWSEDNAAAKAWIAAAKAEFSKHNFTSNVNFTGFVFPGAAQFGKAVFSGDARFDEATFSGEALFDNATFSDDARFNRAMFSCAVGFHKATFSGIAWFSKAKFSDVAWFGNATFFSNALFEKATFSGVAVLSQAVFESYTTFGGATFEKDAMFIAMQGKSFFTLQDATFFQVPDFEQAHFAEAPRLDISEFRPGKPPGDTGDVSARWRALKRLAVQAHDHEREQIFFAEEIKALRGARDRPWPSLDLFIAGKPVWPGGGRYWAGLFYQVFSDFGRSMARPLMGWAGAVLGFAFYYLSRHFADHVPAYPTGMLDWTWGAHFKLTCVAGQGEPLASAIYLAVHKGSIFAGLGGSEKLTQVYACLYGEYGGDRHLPIIPDAVVYAGLGQTVFSAVMIFLFLLAVRNHFRIK